MVNAPYPLETMDNGGVTPSGALVELLKDIAASPNRLQVNANATLEFREGLARRKAERAERLRDAVPIRRTGTKKALTSQRINAHSTASRSEAGSVSLERGSSHDSLASDGKARVSRAATTHCFASLRKRDTIGSNSNWDTIVNNSEVASDPGVKGDIQSRPGHDGSAVALDSKHLKGVLSDPIMRCDAPKSDSELDRRPELDTVEKWPKHILSLLASNEDLSELAARSESIGNSTSFALWTPQSSGLRVVAASSCIPHPEKADSGGADSYYISSCGKAVGVADGVGEWEWRFKCNPRAFADELMHGFSRGRTTHREMQDGSEGESS
jgi:hypothetical protein